MYQKEKGNTEPRKNLTTVGKRQALKLSFKLFSLVLRGKEDGMNRLTKQPSPSRAAKE